MHYTLCTNILISLLFNTEEFEQVHSNLLLLRLRLNTSYLRDSRVHFTKDPEMHPKTISGVSQNAEVFGCGKNM